MRSLGPRSILQLVLLGLGLVALPLIGGLVIAAIQVEELARASRVAVFSSGHAVRTSRTLLEQATELQRAGRQFLVLGDEELHELYIAERTDFQRTVRQVARLGLDEGQRRLLAAIIALEAELFRAVEAHRADPGDPVPEIPAATELTSTAHSLFLTSTRLLADEAQRLRVQAEEMERVVLWTTAALIPSTLLFAVILAILIARPLRQIDAVIHRLARGGFAEPIVVRGPRDLQMLGERLDFLRRRLVDLESQKVSFLRQCSHELKTPLTAIREGAELLADGVVGKLDSGQVEVVRILRENSLRLQRLIESLLRFSVENPLEPSLDLQEIALDALVEQVLEEQRLAVSAKELTVTTELEPIRISGDPDKLRVVLDNLVSNAVKCSPPEATIDIRTRSEAGHAILDVRDAGPGIDHSERERIFEPFYQKATAHEGRVQGTGLGLAIVKEYVRLHEGEVGVVESPRGAHLRVALPLQPGD